MRAVPCVSFELRTATCRYPIVVPDCPLSRLINLQEGLHARQPLRPLAARRVWALSATGDVTKLRTLPNGGFFSLPSLYHALTS